MATYKVIKAHDGLKLGDLRVLEPSSITDYMIQNGYWEEVKSEVPSKIQISNGNGKKKNK